LGQHFSIYALLDHITIFATPTELTRCEAKASYRKGGQPGASCDAIISVWSAWADEETVRASMSEDRLEVLKFILILKFI